MEICKQFEHYLRTECGIQKQHTLLLGVSGGIDSMALLHLLSHHQVDFHIAHCNFGLREAESDGDADFVEKVSVEHGIPLFVKRFDTKQFAKAEGISIQMAARALRLKWFQDLIIQNQYSYTCLAHHLDDQIETVLINMFRGTGIRGLKGMLPNNGKIVRPLLFLNRKQIKAYAIKHDIPFREDSSNLKDDYTRNIIRHHIVPVIHQHIPQLYNVMFDNQIKFSQTISLFDELLQHILTDIQTEHDNVISLNLNALRSYTHLQTLIYELISQYNFNFTQANDINLHIDQTETTCYSSPTHDIFLKNGFIDIVPKSHAQHKTRYSIERRDNFSNIDLPIKLTSELIQHTENLTLIVPLNTALFDFELLQFPLTIRKWKKGDAFIPFGMTQQKLLSDFFIDIKLTQNQKNDIWLLCCGEEIIWIIGYRINDLYKVTHQTTQILKLMLI